MPDDDLTRTAQRAREVLPPPIARLVEDELRRGIAGASYLWHEPYAPLAAAVLALPVSAPDRDALKDFLCNHYVAEEGWYGKPDICHCGASVGDWEEHRADALISAGLVRGPVTAEQVQAGARRIAEFHGREMQQHLDVPLACQVLVAAGLSVEGDEHA